MECEMEKEAASNLETPEDSTNPEKPRAADEEPGHLAPNGDGAEVGNLQETEKLIVIDNASLSEKESPVENGDDGAPKESETESVLGETASPQPDESSGQISQPVLALGSMEPKAILAEQQPVSENDPEPLPVKTHLADSTPEPKPEKQGESVAQAEIQEQTSPEPTALQQSDTQPPSQEDKVSGQAQSPTQLQAAMETQAEHVATADSTKEAGEGKPEEGKVEEASSQKAKEQDDAEAPKEEHPVPAAGSLLFPLLENEQTKDTLRTSRALVVLRGLPGSGKSVLAGAIANAYKDNCTVISADDYGVKPESPETSADGYKALDEATVACCSAKTALSVLIVVDDTNHTQDRLLRLEEIAEVHNLVVIFLEPQTEWRGDPAQLMKKTKRGLNEAQLKAMKGQFEEMFIPSFFAWFLLPSAKDMVVCKSMDFLRTLDTMEAFKKHITDFSGKDEEKEVDLEQYFEAKGPLHCTTKFCDFGKAEGAKEYAMKPAVKDFYGSTSELSLTALFVTPRTVGARVSLTDEQLLLWPDDAEKEAESVVPAASSLPPGSRAHVTLGCAEGVEPVQTGLDLLEILALQKEGQQGETVDEMELGSLTYYGEGRWLLSLREPICTPVCFSSYYQRKEVEPPKKEAEKKKKPKCTIL
ncbi:2',3'-cyclic-nucleotide 3'-phosphodiesterase [Betta splendens]|uniref:2',3'-cyclic-nucleotide 3'-phosphodiesterase n=1 Tax=Betta splendens TaxID=158456 RepID=A0A6P7N7B5_BETSP|nr:2',3'-cyclic-nucleotide 3'-phosphodiesterase [Betta splendens]